MTPEDFNYSPTAAERIFHDIDPCTCQCRVCKATKRDIVLGRAAKSCLKAEIDSEMDWNPLGDLAADEPIVK